MFPFTPVVTGPLRFQGVSKRISAAAETHVCKAEGEGGGRAGGGG